MESKLAQIAEKKIQLFEREFLKLNQVDCLVTHRFGPGVYIREVILPAGACVIGHYHKHPHISIMLKGRMSLINDDDTFTDLEAPITLHCPPGRKIAIIHEDVIWQNIYSTDITDVEFLEDALFEKSSAWQTHQTSSKLLLEPYIDDVDDFTLALQECGFNPDEVRRISEDETDLIPMPWGSFKFMTAPSPIEGKGIFATANIEPGEHIGPARIAGKRTPLGRYTNHAKKPNAEMIAFDTGNIALVATQFIAGSKGGNMGDEITVDYRKVIELNRRLACQQ